MINKKSNINPKGDLATMQAAIEKELYSIGLDLEATAVDYIQRKGISVNADLVKSIKSLVHKEVNGFKLEFGSNVQHAIFVHEGTKPHWAPIAPLKAWALKKFEGTVDERIGIAYAVRQKIAKKGTKARPFLGVALRAHEQKIQGRINTAISEALA